jgi:hypothetical protein
VSGQCVARQMRRPVGEAEDQCTQAGWEKSWHVGRCCCGLGPIRKVIFSIYSKEFQKRSDLIRLKDGLSEYGIIENEIRNNFPYWNFLEFGLEFESKIKKSSRR